jgi:hypothetical protein
MTTVRLLLALATLAVSWSSALLLSLDVARNRACACDLADTAHWPSPLANQGGIPLRRSAGLL